MTSIGLQTPEQKEKDTGSSVAGDLRFCGVCWAGKNGVRLHYCDEKLGHYSDHKCHCGETLKRPVRGRKE